MNTNRTHAEMGTIGLAARERAHTVLHEVIDRDRPLDEVLQTDKRFAGRQRARPRRLRPAVTDRCDVLYSFAMVE